MPQQPKTVAGGDRGRRGKCSEEMAVFTTPQTREEKCFGRFPEGLFIEGLRKGHRWAYGAPLPYIPKKKPKRGPIKLAAPNVQRDQGYPGKKYCKRGITA